MKEMIFWETSMAAARAKTRRIHKTNWVRRHDLQHKALRIRYVREMERELRAERRRIAEAEHVGKIEGGIAAIYARKRMSDAEGINGWRWSRPFDCVL